MKNGIFYAVSLKNVRRYKEMADRRSTIEDVAKRAGVSKSTVSRYLNGKPVRNGNYERIREAVGY